MAFGTPRGWGNGAFATSIWHPTRCCFWGVAHGRTIVPTRSNPKKHRLWQFPVLKCPQHLLENWPQAVQSSQNFYITSFSKSSIDSPKKYQDPKTSWFILSGFMMFYDLHPSKNFRQHMNSAQHRRRRGRWRWRHVNSLGCWGPLGLLRKNRQAGS
jgi:hypothetical protein